QRPYYELVHSNEQIPRSLVRDFVFRSGTDPNYHGTLHWDVAGNTRILGRGPSGGETVVHLASGSEIAALPASGSKRLIKGLGRPNWYTVDVPHDVLPDGPPLAQRHGEQLYGPRGPRPEDARQGAGKDCALIAPLKVMADHNPHLIRDMLHDYGDGTVGVRLRVNGTDFAWVRVEKSIY
ncbi:hypothetical protein ACW9HQ_51045, partial [Nocardia gipuzkoensis]